MKLTTKQIATAGIMLALAIASQFLKGLSVFITGSIINLILIITTLYCGMFCGSVIAIITPITSFFITGSPIIAAVPLIMPCIMIGNEILVLSIGLIKKAIIAMEFNLPKVGTKREVALLAPSMIIGSILKALFMSVAIVRIIIPTFGASLKPPMIVAANIQFSTTQLVTALIGGALACVIWPIVKKVTRNVDIDSVDEDASIDNVDYADGDKSANTIDISKDN